MQACHWLQKNNNRQQAAEILAAPEFLDMDQALISPSLTGQIVQQSGDCALHVPDFHLFGAGAAAIPDTGMAEALAIESMALLGSRVDQKRAQDLAHACFKPDLYEEAARYFLEPNTT